MTKTRKDGSLACNAGSFVALCVLVAVSGCGGSGGSDDPVSSGTGSGTGSSAPTTAQRTQAATTTSQNNPACTAIRPFYWEIGDRSVALTSGSVGGTQPNAATPMLIASASKWIFGAYVTELRLGQLSPGDIAALTMTSGYTNLTYGSCIRLSAAAQNAESVSDCLNSPRNLGSGNNGDFNANAVGRFFYNGGHFQKHAAQDLGLGNANNASLAAAVAVQLGTDFSFTYDSPQLAAGVSTTAADYAFFLRKILSNQLRMRDRLGANAVCTNPRTCATALSAPMPANESWHYSLGHWVEDDPATGDGSFSSPGAFGFYPWISADKSYYGVIARHATQSNTMNDTVAFDSVACGQRIRKAWLSATAQ